MKKLIGLVLIILAIILGLYVGLWLCFIGGIVQIVHAINVAIQGQAGIPALPIALGIVRIIFAGLAGFLTFFVFLAPGVKMFVED